MTVFDTLRDDYYEDFRQEFGDGEFALDMANDAAKAKHQGILAIEEQKENFERDLYASIERDNAIRSPTTPSVVGSAAGIGAVLATSPVALGAVFVIGFGLAVCWLCEDTEKANTVGPSVNNRLDRLEGDIDAIRQNQGEMQEILNRLSLPKAA